MRRALFTPRLLPLAMLAMLALAGVKSAGLIRQALAESGSAPAKPAAPTISVPAPAPAKAPMPAPGAAGVPPQVFVPPAPAPAGEPPISEAERGLLLDLRKRRTELDTRELALGAREGVLGAAEKRLAARVDELANLQGRLEALETARLERDAENWRGLVRLYETMKPREAAAIFNDLDKPVLLAVLDRMKEAKAAPVLAAMQPERARQITAELAQRRTQANRPANLPTPARPTGG